MNTQELVNALETLPELKAEMEKFVSIALNKNSQIELADDAEDCILEVSPKLNKATLQAWAENHSDQKSTQFAQRHKSARKDIKKN